MKFCREFRIRDIRNPASLEVPANFEEEINRWTLDSVSVVAFDKQLGILNENRESPLAKELFTKLREFFTLSAQLEFSPSLWKLFPTPSFKRMMNVLDSLQNVTLDLINQSKERLEKEQQMGISRPESEQSVLEKLLKIDPKIATVMAMDMLIAGVDTVSSFKIKL